MSDWYVSSAAWAAIAQFATGSYTVGQIVRPLTAPAFGAQYVFRCTTAGSASAEPTWPAGNNATVTATGGAVFTNVSGQSAYGWSAAVGNLYCLTANGASGRMAVGDRAFLSSDHSETSASSTSYILMASGQTFGVIQVISVNRAGSVPPAVADYLAGAAIAVSAGSFTLDPACNDYWQGVTFTLSGTGTGFVFANLANKGHYFRNCAFVLTTSTTTATIGTNVPSRVTFDNTTVSFSNAGHQFKFGANSVFDWINTPAATLGTVPTVLFGINALYILNCRGVDLSAVTTTLLYQGTTAVGKALLDSCRIAPGVVRLGTTAYSNTIDEIELVNCFDGTNTNISERHTPGGDVTTNRSTTLVGGAQDDVGLFSHMMVSSTRSDGFAMTLDSFWMDVENLNIGSSHTATVEIISSATLNNTDISLVLEYLGTSGSSLASFSSSLPSALTASAAVPTSTATWNNPPATPVTQHLQVTFTPQTAGRLRGLVRLGRVSTTVYVNPQITVT